MMSSIEEYASRSGIKPRTVKKAVKDNRIRSQRLRDGSICIPDNEIRPLTESQIQDFLWVVLKYKNSPNVGHDISLVEGIRNREIESVFLQLAHRKYLDGIGDVPDQDTFFGTCRITEKGFNLLQKKKLPGSFRSKAIQALETIQLVCILVNRVHGWLAVSGIS